MTNYIMPTAEDVPPIHVYFEEIPFQHGAFGAKGIGELPHDGPATRNSERHQGCDRRELQFNSAVARIVVREIEHASNALIADGRMNKEWPTIRLAVNGEMRAVRTLRHETVAGCFA